VSAATVERAIAIVGVGAVLPDAPDVPTLWDNLLNKRYSISDVDPERWNPDYYFDADRQSPNKTYSKIGGWVREWAWSPLEWRLPIPPKVSDSMDRTQQWAIVAARQALADYGHPERPLDHDRTAVVVGNAMGGDLHYLTSLAVYLPEYADELRKSPAFAALPDDVRSAVIEELRIGMNGRFPAITEDTMPGELANIIAGRLANLFDFHGPNFIVDAACASAMAAIDAAVEGLEEGAYDAVLTGGVDANMSASTFVKFCKIGALSATGTRPFGEGADGFVMGEGAALFLLKRLADAEAAGDHVHAVIRGIGGASDGKGKGITAPNPIGQRLAIQRAWANAGITPTTATLIEAHGTSTKVGDVVESQSIADAFADYGLPPGSLALGSIKSNLGHLKGAAGAAGMLKAALALDHKQLPPSLGAETLNPNIDFASSPLRVNTDLRDWDANGHVRSAGVSAFGFGGTNFHMVLEEHVPGRLTAQRSTFAIGATATAPPSASTTAAPTGAASTAPSGADRPVAPARSEDLKAPLRGLVVVGGPDDAAVSARLVELRDRAAGGTAPAPSAPAEADLRAPVRVAIDFADAADLAAKASKAITALDTGNEAAWRLLRNQGVFRGSGDAHQVAMLYTGQGSQYVNMLAELRRVEPIVGEVFDEADRIMEPLIGRPLTDIIFVDPDDDAAVAEANHQLMQTEITQPAVLTVDRALMRLFEAYGIDADMVMGHSLGEYGALVAARALPFADALEAVSARGREMANVDVDDNGLMLAVFAPLDEIERTLESIDDYVVVANLNSGTQAVVGGSTAGVEAAQAKLAEAGHQVVRLPVSHAFHTEIVAPAAGPLRDVLQRLDVRPPEVPTVANVDGRFYPMGPAVVPDMIDILCRQIASPVQFITGLHTLHDAGARVFVEVGPKRALTGFVEEVLGASDPEVVALHANHPKTGDVVSFNQALAGLYAAGHGVGTVAEDASAPTRPTSSPVPTVSSTRSEAPMTSVPTTPVSGDGRYLELGRMLADVIERGSQLLGTSPGTGSGAGGGTTTAEPVVVTGAGLGLPGTERVFDDANLARLLDGQSFIEAIPVARRQAIVDKKITRLVKTESGGGRWETIDSPHDVVKLAGQRGELDLVADFGLSPERVAALDSSSELAIGAGIDALRDAGIPLTLHYKATTTGGTLPDRWGLPDSMRDDTGVIFASAFPGLDNMTREVTAYERDRARRERLAGLEHLRERISDDDPAVGELEHMIHEVRSEIEADPYAFDRRFLFRILSMGHSQFAEHIGARGPNTQVNAACASTTQAMSIAEDWIRLGRCNRVVIISGDEASNESLMEWIGAGFLASGAAATDDVVEDAALPFDRRRHGMLIGMGAAAIVVERADVARARGVAPICELLAGATANSAFHGSRLDVDHICGVMEGLVADAERRWGVSRSEIARNGVFVSHETYTPARGGSAQAEVNALRSVFGADADSMVIANTKGFTGHAMGVGVEDVLAVKALETGIVPPIANVKEVDPELGVLNLSKGGVYPVRYALRLGAGFGSQIAMSLLRWTPTADGRHREPDELGFEYRISDRAAWQRFLADASGYADPQIEVVSRTLRIRDEGPPANRPVPVAKSVAAAPEVVSAPPPTPVREPVTAPAVAEPAIEEPAASGEDPVVAQVLSVVAAQTGYPADMLELDLDLEADLGIDTVKQAETFAAIREHYGIERDDNLSLRDYPTLAHVVGFVRDRATNLPAHPPPHQQPHQSHLRPPTAPRRPAPTATTPSSPRCCRSWPHRPATPPTCSNSTSTSKPTSASTPSNKPKPSPPSASTTASNATTTSHYATTPPSPTSSASSATAPPTSPRHQQRRPHTPQVPEAAAARTAAGSSRRSADGEDPVVTQVLSVVAAQTGYPADMLELDLDLEADLGIDTVKQAETFAAIREHYGIERDDNLSLRDYPTLAHVVGFVRDRATNLPATHRPPRTLRPHRQRHQPASANGDDPVVATVLGVVAAQTGYPADMLELDLDLEADLGIDTVKQAETFAAIREHYGIERDDNLSLRDYPTLAHVVGFVRDRATNLASATPATAEDTAPATDGGDGASASPATTLTLAVGDDEATRGLLRRSPAPVLRPPLDCFVETGVALDEGAPVVVMADSGGVGAALAGRLEQRGVDVLLIDDRPDADGLLARVSDWLGERSLRGVYWLPALDGDTPIADQSIDDWRDGLRIRVKLLFRLLRDRYDDFGTGTFLVSATRLGGTHGYGEQGADHPMGGGVVGLTKSFKRERPDVLAKAIDFAPSRKTAALADTLIEETLRDPGAMEIGWRDDERCAIALVERDLPDGEGIQFGADTTFLVTGAAGSIVSAIIGDLARASGGTFHLLDLAPAPDPDDADVSAFEADRDALKMTIFERLRAAGERATPALVEKELSGIERRHAALAALRAIEASGGSAHYHQVDLRDADAMAAVMADVVATSESVDVLVHAGGLEISRSMPDKSPEEYDLVFDVKADGWFNLVKGLPAGSLQAAVVFSSIAGRFGNAGQPDYSAANDLLCKQVAALGSTHPDAIGLALDWTAWGDIGMATRGSIPQIMAAAGIDMLPAAAGIPVLRHELEAGGPSREMVVAGRLGVMGQELHPTGGLAVDGDAPLAARATAAGRVTISGVRALTLADGLVTTATLDPTVQPFLDDHRIDGTAVLPGVMGVESFAAAASLLLPDHHVAAIEDVDFLAPFKFYRDEPREIIVTAQFEADGDDVVVRCALIGERTLANQDEPQTTVHFTGTVRLRHEPTGDLGTIDVPDDNDREVDADDIYRIYFHGPAYQVLDEAWAVSGADGPRMCGEWDDDVPAGTDPADASLVTVPRWLELCFQTAGRLGDRNHRCHGTPDAPRPSRVQPTAPARASRRSPSSPRRTNRGRAPMRSSPTTTAPCSCDSPATGPSNCRGPSATMSSRRCVPPSPTSPEVH
jgi:acyl transferase domain-containing protein/acyl carrier protein